MRVVTQFDQIGYRSDAALFVSVEEAAKLAGLPQSLLEKSFMDPAKRPSYAPPPPPHFRAGRSIYIYTEKLSAWAKSLTEPARPDLTILDKPRRPGRPTRAEKVARAAAERARQQIPEVA